MKLVWDETGKKYYELGVSKGVLYPQNAAGTGYDKGVAWNGLTAVNENPEGAEANDIYADNIKYASIRSAETFGATIEAYTYPEEFAECDGSAELAAGVYIGQQNRKPFAFCYRTEIGNDTQGDSDDGYKLHIIYGATASPSSKDYSTINDSPDAITFSWEIETTPVNVTDHKPTACVVIDTTKLSQEAKTYLKTLEDKLYGTNASGGNEGTEPTLVMPDDIKKVMTTGSFT